MDDLLYSAVQRYLAQIRNRYVSYNKPNPNDPVAIEVSTRMIIEFCDSLSYEVGRKYIKVTKGSGSNVSVHSFIVLKDDAKFKRGDVLKAASWATPARNFARGNILSGTCNPEWTGV